MRRFDEVRTTVEGLQPGTTEEYHQALRAIKAVREGLDSFLRGKKGLSRLLESVRATLKRTAP